MQLPVPFVGSLFFTVLLEFITLFDFHFGINFSVRVIISRKIHFMQRIVSLFGPVALKEILEAPHPVILPFMLYEHSFDVFVYILL